MMVVLITGEAEARSSPNNRQHTREVAAGTDCAPELSNMSLASSFEEEALRMRCVCLEPAFSTLFCCFRICSMLVFVGFEFALEWLFAGIAPVVSFA